MNLFERNYVAAILLKIEAIYSLWLPLKSDKVAITHLTMETHFQTTDYVVGARKVPEQHACNSLGVINHLIILGKCALTYSKVGQSSQNPKNMEGHKNSLGPII